MYPHKPRLDWRNEVIPHLMQVVDVALENLPEKENILLLMADMSTQLKPSSSSSSKGGEKSLFQTVWTTALQAKSWLFSNLAS